MSEELTIRIRGRYSSIQDMDWVQVPRMAVITGQNGVGKSQLLEIIAASTGALDNPTNLDQNGTISAKAEFLGETFQKGDVFHSYGEWNPLNSSVATEDQVKTAIQVLQASRLQSYLKSLASDLKTDVEEIRLLTPKQFIRILTPTSLWAHSDLGNQSLSFLFLAYRILEREALEAGETNAAFKARVGEEPWLLLRSVISAAGLPLSINEPPVLKPMRFATYDSFSFELYDSEKNVVPIDRLSSGERVLMSTAMWRFKAEAAGRHFKMLLLDEPDAHLHPSLTRRFLNVIQSVFVEQRGVRVIMTTHSPSTVALSPSEALFEMRRSEPRLTRVDRSTAIATLTGGFVAVQDATRTVFLEGKDDPPFYNLIWQLMTEKPLIGHQSLISPYPSIDFVYGQGREIVQALVPQLRLAGFLNFYGLIDRDEGNIPKDGVFVVARYAIENYLYDPLVIWFLLNKEGRAPIVGIDQEGGISSARGVSQEHLQLILNRLAAEVENVFPPQDEKERKLVEVPLVNGARIQYPGWCLYRRKAYLKNQFGRLFGQFSQHKLLKAYAESDVLPMEMVKLFQRLQRGINS